MSVCLLSKKKTAKAINTELVDIQCMVVTRHSLTQGERVKG